MDEIARNECELIVRPYKNIIGREVPPRTTNTTDMLIFASLYVRATSVAHLLIVYGGTNTNGRQYTYYVSKREKENYRPVWRGQTTRCSQR